MDYETWKILTPDVKAKVARVLGIKRSNGSNHVETGLFNGQMRTIIRSDGYTNTDVEKITVEFLQEFLSSAETNFDQLWQLTLEKITSPNFDENERKENRTEQGTADRAGAEETSGGETKGTGSSGEEAQNRAPKTTTRSDRQPGPERN